MEGAKKISRVSCWRAAFFASAAALLPAEMSSQGRTELRADVLLAQPTAIHAGAGVLFPVGTYLRSGVVAGAGKADSGASFRIDLVTAFHLDPFRESRWGPYGGGGISVRHDQDSDRQKAALLILLGLEGPARGSFAPAFELGLGGGIRAGLVMRRGGGRTR